MSRLKISAFEEEYYAYEISEERAAIFLNCTVLHLKHLRENRKSPKFRINERGHAVYKRGDLMAWLKRKKSKKKR